MSQLPTATVSSPTPTAQRLTPDQVCDLPMGDLLARTNVRIGVPIDLSNPDYIDADTDHFFGYLVDRKSGVTLHIRSDATEVAHDVYVRYLITQHLGLPTHLFPAELQHTVFSGATAEAVQA